MQVVQPEWLWTPEGVRTGWCVTIHGTNIVGLQPATRHTNVDVSLPGHLLLPGLVNAHSHAFQRAFRGRVQWARADGEDFWTWRQSMYGVASTLPPEGVEAVSRLAFLEMAEAGITAVGEFHYLHHQPDGHPYADPDELARRVVAAALDVGVRITLLRTVYGRCEPGVELLAEQRRFGDRSPEDALLAVERLSRGADARVRVGLAPHSVRAVAPEWLPELASFGGVIHAHVSEQPRENALCRAETGLGPTELLERAGLLSPRFTAVHLTHPEPGDVERVVHAGASVCACPSTELDLGDGFLPLAARDARLCVGSDSQAVIHPLGEARDLELHARALAGHRIVMAPPGDPDALAHRLLRIATHGGAAALGLPAEGLVEGAPADLVAIDLRRPAAVGVPPLQAAAFLATPDWVADVWVDGVRIVADGRHPARERIVDAARAWL